LRRLRAALRAFRRVAPRRLSRRVRRRLKHAATSLGEARDWDVLCQWLASGKRPSTELEARRDAARRRARKAVRSPEFMRALADADALARGMTRDVPLMELAAHALDKSHRRVAKAARREPWDNAPARHALRIRVKRLRYCCDYFAPRYRASEGYVDSVKALQDVLGQLNDAAVARRLLAEAAHMPPAVRASLERREARLIRRLPRAWRAFEDLRPFWKAPR
jgi:CHAD domain-containing protein